jgi:hypothetical protein
VRSTLLQPHISLHRHAGLPEMRDPSKSNMASKELVLDRSVMLEMAADCICCASLLVTHNSSSIDYFKSCS